MLYKNKAEERVTMKAIALCFKPYLKPEEAMIYCNLESKQLYEKCKEHGIFKSSSGYYKKEDLDRMMEGDNSIQEQANLLASKIQKPRQMVGKRTV